jgi:hypothetical protein
MSKTVCLLTALLAGCTLSTAAGDREIADQVDIQLTMIDMSAHRGAPLDIALISTTKGEMLPWLRGRARIIMPPEQPGVPYPDVTALFSRAYFRDEPFSLLFYNDNDDDYSPRQPPLGLPLDREHSWVNEVPAAGAVRFKHSTDFRDFNNESYRVIGRDVVFSPPDTGGSRGACYQQLLEAHVQNELEVRIVYHPDEENTQVGLFKTYRGNGLPTVPVRLVGLSDTGSRYGIIKMADGVVVATGLSEPAGEEGLPLAFSQWFPAPDAELAACAARP